MLGRAPVVDFDGTLARLEIAWDDLRRALGVARISDLWARNDDACWATVTRLEWEAAQTAQPIAAVVAALSGAQALAILSSNAEACIRQFLDRFPDLASRAVLVVGRETLGGPKTDFDVFARGFAACADATSVFRGNEPVVYVGDLDYELAFARRLGALAFSVDDLT